MELKLPAWAAEASSTEADGSGGEDGDGVKVDRRNEERKCLRMENSKFKAQVGVAPLIPSVTR
jgi:hypothetical protein